MLRISRKRGEWFRIKLGDKVAWIGIHGAVPNKAHIVIDAPREIVVERAELVPQSEIPTHIPALTWEQANG